MYDKRASIKPAIRNNCSNVRYIGITSPHGKAKENLRSRLREATATVWCPPGITADDSISHSAEIVKTRDGKSKNHPADFRRGEDII